MFVHAPWVRTSSLVLLLVGTLLCGADASEAQSSGGGIELHANRNVSAATIGLPDYPGARRFQEPSNDSAGDVGFTFGDVHFRILISKYVTSASEAQLLAFYRKPLSRYGEVLECEHGEAVGPHSATSGGLTCSNEREDHAQESVDESAPHELRAGSPEKYRIVAIENSRNDLTRFTLILLELPRENASDERHR